MKPRRNTAIRVLTLLLFAVGSGLVANPAQAEAPPANFTLRGVAIGSGTWNFGDNDASGTSNICEVIQTDPDLPTQQCTVTFHIQMGARCPINSYGATGVGTITFGTESFDHSLAGTVTPTTVTEAGPLLPTPVKPYVGYLSIKGVGALCQNEGPSTPGKFQFEWSAVEV